MRLSRDFSACLRYAAQRPCRSCCYVPPSTMDMSSATLHACDGSCVVMRTSARSIMPYLRPSARYRLSPLLLNVCPCPPTASCSRMFVRLIVHSYSMSAAISAMLSSFHVENHESDTCDAQKKQDVHKALILCAQQRYPRCDMQTRKRTNDERMLSVFQIRARLRKPGYDERTAQITRRKRRVARDENGNV